MPDKKVNLDIETDSPIELAEALQMLRKQLMEAQDAGKDEPLRFGISDIEVEMQVTVGTQKGVSGGAKFWVLNAQGKNDSTSQVVQKIKLKLSAEGDDDLPVLISDPVIKPAD